MPIVDQFKGTFSSVIPDSLSGQGVITVIYTIAMAFVIAGVLSGIVYLIWNHYRYDQRIVVYKKIGDQIKRTLVDKAMTMRQSKEGDFIFKTKRSKKFLPNPTIQSGPKEYWYYIREDGEWINFGMGDLDEQFKKAGAKYIDHDMRMARLAIGKNLADRLQTKTFWEKYGQMISMVIWVLIITVSMVIVLKQLGDVVDKIASIASHLEQVAKNVADLSTRQTSGVVPA